MPLVEPSFVRGGYAYRPASFRRSMGAAGTIKPGKAFNHFGAIADAFPEALSSIVRENTELLGRVTQALAPTQQNPRKGDPEPGTLKASMRTRLYKRRGSDLVQTGKVEFPAKDPRGHRYARPLYAGSKRRTKTGLKRVMKGSGWFVPPIQAVRRKFYRDLSNLESRLPR